MPFISRSRLLMQFWNMPVIFLRGLFFNHNHSRVKYTLDILEEEGEPEGACSKLRNASVFLLIGQLFVYFYFELNLCIHLSWLGQDKTPKVIKKLYFSTINDVTEDLRIITMKKKKVLVASKKVFFQDQSSD